MKMSKEKEFYSKVCVAKSLNPVELPGEALPLNYLGMSATILANDKEAVAVNLKILPNKCTIYISKNTIWLKEDIEYINKIKEIITSVSKDAPMTFKEACEREDVIALYSDILNYNSVELECRLNKLKREINYYRDKEYITDFLAKIHNDKITDEMDIYTISYLCYNYYESIQDEYEIPNEVRKNFKKVGSYARALTTIINCMRNKNYKPVFFNIDLHLLDPIMADQTKFSWNSIIKNFISVQKEYEDFKKGCLKSNNKKNRLKNIYGGIGIELDNEKIDHINLHAELNILTNIIMNQDKKSKIFIGVSKKCCYLCELYIKFLQFKGYKITIPKTNKKLCQGWKLPETFKKEFITKTLFNLNQIIKYELEHINTDDSDEELERELEIERMIFTIFE